MSADYKEYDESGRLVSTIKSVIDSVALTGVETSSGSNLITVASTTGVYPGMPIACPNIPPGSFVHAVKSATVLELWCSVFNLTTGVASTIAANANATATATGLLARALGFCPRTIVALAYFEGAWRNIHSFATNIGAMVGNVSPSLTDGTSSYARAGFGPGMAVMPTAGSLSSGVLTISAVEYLKSDHLAATPLKRHNGEVWGVHVLTSTGGQQSKVPARPGGRLIYSGA